MHAERMREKWAGGKLEIWFLVGWAYPVYDRLVRAHSP